MAAVAGTMYSFFQNSKMEGAYMLLFALSLVILYTMGRDREKTMVLYSVLLLATVIFNPLTVWILSLIFPAAGDFKPIVGLIPVLVCVPYGITILVYNIKNSRVRKVVCGLLLLYVAICGNFFGMFGGNTSTARNLYDPEKQKIVDYLSGSDSELVLADDGILPFITAYGGGVPLIYGEDIMLFDGDLGIMDRYDNAAIELHNLMWEPQKNMDEIADMAYEQGCDIIVAKRYAESEDVAGHYKADIATDDYIVYRIGD